MSYVHPADHRSMVFDIRRNEAYYAALQQVITPETVVLDLGAGLGILGLLAAKLGARRVYCVEPEDVLLIARQVARANKLDDRIVCVQGRIEDIELPERVDVVVSAFTGNMLLTEDLLPSLLFARDHYLKPGGVLIPNRARIEVVPVELTAVFEREVAIWSQPTLGLDFSVARTFAANTAFYRSEGVRGASYLAEPRSIYELDFQTAQYNSCDATAEFEIMADGCCHGWVGWLAMELGDIWLSTAPHEPETHWSPIFMPVDPPLALKQGDRASFRLVRPAFTDWSWTVQAGQEQRRHSTLFSRPWDAQTIRKVSPGYQPQLNSKGQMVQDLLGMLDGQTSIQDIAHQLHIAYPNRLHSLDEAVAFVRKYSSCYD